MIHVSRILLFLGFLFLWEVSARRRWIDSFIFSSPSEIWQTFFTMIQDQSLFTHIGITLTETLVSFVFTVFLGIGTAVLLWCCPKLSRILEPYLVVLNSLPKSALAPTPDCMAGCKYTHNHCRRNVCGDLWLDHQSLHWLPRS